VELAANPHPPCGGVTLKQIIPKTIVVMGVSGCGKSFIGDRLAQALGGTFADADDFHPPANLEKMANGIPLTDADRWPWLEVLREQIVLHRSRTACYVLACSALKQSYRDRLRADDSQEILNFVYLKGSKELILQRMEQRNHFMPPALLDSQCNTLEEPFDAIDVDIELSPDDIVGMILDHFSEFITGRAAIQEFLT
jgi:gluconokinase